MAVGLDPFQRIVEVGWSTPWLMISATLDDHSSPQGNFVRADITGPGGVSTVMFVEYQMDSTFGIPRVPTPPIPAPAIVDPPTDAMKQYYSAWVLQWGGPNPNVPGGGPNTHPTEGKVYVDLNAIAGSLLTFFVKATFANYAGSGEVGVTANAFDKTSAGVSHDAPTWEFSVVVDKAAKTVEVRGGYSGGGGEG